MTDTFGICVQVFLLSSVLDKRKIISSCSKVLFSSAFCFESFGTKHANKQVSAWAYAPVKTNLRGNASLKQLRKV